MSEARKVLFRREGPIGTFTLDRPEKRNALNDDIWSGLDLCLEEARAEEDLRAIILCGEGRSFCSGLDLSPENALFQNLGSGGSPARNSVHLLHHIRKLEATFSGLERLPIPVIAAIQGHCLGGGLELACACDIRLASSDAVFSIPEVKLGIIADLGGTQRLARIVGQGMARELLFTGRRFDAKEALEMRFVNHVLPSPEELMAEAKRMALEIAENAPLAVQGAKDVMNFSADHSIQDGLDYVSARSAAILMSEDVFEAFAAFAERRKPDFKGR